MVQLDELAYRLVMSVPRYRKRLLFVVIGSLMSLYLTNKKHIDERISGRFQAERKFKDDTHKHSNRRRVGVNALFIAQMKRILPICIPSKNKHNIDCIIYRPEFRHFIKRVWAASYLGRNIGGPNLSRYMVYRLQWGCCSFHCIEGLELVPEECNYIVWNDDVAYGMHYNFKVL